MKNDNKKSSAPRVNKATQIIAGLLVAALVFGAVVITISVLLPTA